MAGSESSIGPVFIIGVPRSGTTLLVNLLGSHPLLAPIYETRFLISPWHFGQVRRSVS